MVTVVEALAHVAVRPEVEFDRVWLDETSWVDVARGWLAGADGGHGALLHHGAVRDISPASGDLLVMGGRAQADWEHAVPKVRDRVGPRISLQWRWTSRRGRPVQGPSYRAPRNFSS